MTKKEKYFLKDSYSKINERLKVFFSNKKLSLLENYRVKKDLQA